MFALIASKSNGSTESVWCSMPSVDLEDSRSVKSAQN